MSNKQKLGDFIKLQGGYAFKSSDFSEQGVPIVRISNIRNNKLDFSDAAFYDNEIKNNLSDYLIEEEDVLIAMSGATTGKVGITSKDNLPAIINQRVGRFVIQDKEKLSKKFLRYLVQSSDFINQVNIHAIGGAQPNISAKQIESISLYIPEMIKEQQKIAEILSSVDVAIEKTEQVISKTEEVKKGLMQQLLTKGIGHTQFKETEIGQIPVEWEYVTIDNIFSEYKETTNDISNYSLYSLTIEEGLVPKSDRYERSFLLKDKDNNQYRMVKNNNVVFNPMNLRLGAITLYTENKPVLVSAYYNILSVNDNLEINPRYFGYLFSSSKYINLYERVSTGSLVEKKRVHLSQFLKIYIPIPPLQEQNYIVKIIDSVETKIKKENKNLIKLKECKQGLMQQLLTGKTRVKID